MEEKPYCEGDFIVIRDKQKANQTIAMSGDIEEGVIVRIKNIRSEMLICDNEEPPNGTKIKPFPPAHGLELIVNSDGQVDLNRSDSRIADDNLASDLSKYLSEDQDSTSNVLK